MIICYNCLMIKLVLIDFDDTLCLTEKACFELENFVAQKMGYSPMTRETHLKNWGKPLVDAISERIPGVDVNAYIKAHEKIMPEFIKNGQLDIITDINLKTLATLREHGIKTAILTARSVMEAKHLLDENHPLTAKIDKFYHRDNTEYKKTDPKVYDKILQHFKVKPNETVYVGDSISDAVTAKAAGLHFVALLESGLKTKKDFNYFVPVDFFATKFEDILIYLKR